MIDYDGGHPLVWIGVGMTLMAFFMPLTRTASWPVVLVVVGAGLVARGAWVVWRSRG